MFVGLSVVCLSNDLNATQQLAPYKEMKSSRGQSIRFCLIDGFSSLESLASSLASLDAFQIGVRI